MIDKQTGRQQRERDKFLHKYNFAAMGDTLVSGGGEWGVESKSELRAEQFWQSGGKPTTRLPNQMAWLPNY